MHAWIGGGLLAACIGSAGMALAQGSVVAERRAGLDRMQGHLDAIAAVVQSRGDQRQIAARVEEMVLFFRSMPDRFPAGSLPPAVPQGTQQGQTRALPAIDSNRATLAERSRDMVEALGTLRAAAEAGGVTPDLLRSTAATCTACHRSFRAR